MDRSREKRRSLWVTHHVLPAEPLVRAWLARSMVSREDSDDLIQEAYCRLAGVEAFETIVRPDGFFFQIVRNLLLTQVKRARLVRIETVAEIEELNLVDGSPSPEQVTGARQDLDRVQKAIAALPERTARIFQLRRIEGLSQREIAERMNVSENVVEHAVSNAIRAVVRSLRDTHSDLAPDFLPTRLRGEP